MGGGRARQLVLDLPARPALGRADFYITPANALALAQIDAWPDWPEGRMAVIGPEASGKTHLVHVWAGRAGARILPASRLADLDPLGIAADAAVAVEDAEALPALETGVEAEEVLFHLCNRLHSGGGSLLLTGKHPPARWGLRLPDLSSRLRIAGVARLDAPDDELLSAVLLKLFADRQVEVSADLVEYLLPRMERSFSGAEKLVNSLDRAALSRKRAITPRLAAEVLRNRAP
jgi:chromosomal replication initiation ATPase DnaA